MNEEIFNELLEMPYIFKNKRVFDPNFFPDKMSSQQSLSMLLQIFHTIFFTSRSTQLVITGEKGVGKTHLVKCFAKICTRFAEERSGLINPLDYYYLNCKESATERQLLYHLLRSLDKTITASSTTLSMYQLVKRLCHRFALHKKPLLIILDHLHHLKYGAKLLHLLHLLTNTRQKMTFLIGVVDEQYIQQMTDLPNNDLSIMRCMPCNKEVIFDILNHRAKLGLQCYAFTDTLLRKITERVHLQNGDLAYGIALLQKCATIAEQENLTFITSTCFLKAIGSPSTITTLELLQSMNKEALLLLSAILQVSNKVRVVTLYEVLEIYYRSLENRNLPLTSIFTVWKYLLEFKAEQLIQRRIVLDLMENSSADLEQDLDRALLSKG